MKTKILTILIIVSLLAGCNLIDNLKSLFSSETSKVVQVLDQAISSLDAQSANWQEILNKAMEDLPDQVSNTVRSDVSNLLQRTVAAASGEVRCDVDFFRVRVQQWLQEIKAKYLGSAQPVMEPNICSVVPTAVDLSLSPNQRNLIEFFGYDFDQAQMQVLLKSTNGSLVDIAQHLQKQTHYHMTLNLGSNGVQFDRNCESVTLRWNNIDISTVSVIQPTTPICETSYKEIAPNNITFIPSHYGNGDSEYNGHGPNTNCYVSLTNHGDHIVAKIFMDAKETKSDWTEARGSKDYIIYNADPDKTIEKIVSPSNASMSYRDTNHENDLFGGNGCISSFNFVGDTSDDEAGTRTCVTVAFNPIRIQLKEKGNCVSTMMLKTLNEQKQISPKLIEHVQKFEKLKNIQILK